MPLFHIHDPVVQAQKQQFEWGRHLGSGTFGEVSLCHWKTHDPPVDVAIKVVPKSRVMNKTAQVNIMNKLKGLHHPHMVNLIDWFQSREHYYIVFELAVGGELFDHLFATGRYSEPDSQIMVRDIVDSVAYFHSQKLVHRDLKPENFLIRGSTSSANAPPFDIIVADFGVSHQLVKDDEVMRTVAGSPGYTAPEVYKFQGYTKAVDMWSVGVVAFVLITGRFPFKNLEGKEFIKEAEKEEVYFPREPWEKVSEEARDFVKRCLRVDPRERLTAQEALAHTVHPLLLSPQNKHALTKYC